MTTTETTPRPDRCPRCDSPAPNLHPAMQADGGEVQPCPHSWHGPQPEWIRRLLAPRAERAEAGE